MRRAPAFVAWFAMVSGCSHVDAEVLSRARNGTVAVCAVPGTTVWREELVPEQRLSDGAAVAAVVAVVLLLPVALLLGGGGSLLGGGGSRDRIRPVLSGEVVLSGVRLETAFARQAAAVSGLKNIVPGCNAVDDSGDPQTLRVSLNQGVRGVTYEAHAIVLGTRRRVPPFACTRTVEIAASGPPLDEQVQALAEDCAGELGRQFGAELAEIARSVAAESR